jgi:hypothetical protein
MKKLFLVLALAFGTSINAQTKGLENPSKGFDFDLFQKTLTQEMKSQFDWMMEDTTINYVAKSITSEEARYHPSNATKKAGMVNLSENEIDQAKRLVLEYKKELFESRFFGEKSLKKYYVEFSAVATKQRGGLIRYGMVIDNNITREEILGMSPNVQ